MGQRDEGEGHDVMRRTKWNEMRRWGWARRWMNYSASATWSSRKNIDFKKNLHKTSTVSLLQISRHVTVMRKRNETRMEQKVAELSIIRYSSRPARKNDLRFVEVNCFFPKSYLKMGHCSVEDGEDCLDTIVNESTAKQGSASNVPRR